MKLLVKPLDDNVKMFYKNHSTYNEGDSGLDLFFIDNYVVEPHSTLMVDLRIQCEAFYDNENDKNVSYYLYPRSSISKTPLRFRKTPLRIVKIPLKFRKIPLRISKTPLKIINYHKIRSKTE